jgi:hypothetical protein
MGGGGGDSFDLGKAFKDIADAPRKLGEGIAHGVGIPDVDLLKSTKESVGSWGERTMKGATIEELTNKAKADAEAAAPGIAAAQAEAEKQVDVTAQAQAATRRRTPRTKTPTMLTPNAFAGAQTTGQKTLLGQ